MNSTIAQWAHRHGIPQYAVRELWQIMGTMPPELSPPDIVPGMTEAGVQSRVRLAAAQAGYMVFRNNVGALRDDNGRVLRFGLANDSKAMNDAVKSSDLIGIKPNGQFWARECKAEGWQYTGTPHERAQLKFIELILAMGGDAGFSVGGI